jgi:hypothetical protein
VKSDDGAQSGGLVHGVDDTLVRPDGDIVDHPHAYPSRISRKRA